ncbi:diguanylate cyclase [Yoonia sp.]|uniref:diguanylate cyclase domain-containing protein n=1 Tax=Yoonia sp. TaxID=2212373 RepID=UPI0025D52180|nr:diguanylate cyclase [Yoonia sp.]
MTSSPPDQDEVHRLPRRIFWASVGNGVTAILVILAMTFWMARKVDVIASENAVSLMDSAVQAELLSVAISTQDYAYWDLASDLLIARDDDAFFTNFGTGATDGATFDFIYVLGSDGQPIYAYQTDGEASDTSIVDTALTDRLRLTLSAQPMEPYTTISHYARIGGQLAVLAAGRIQSTDTTGFQATQLPMMVGGKWLNPDRLSAIGALLMITNVQLQTADTSVIHGKAVLEIDGPAGTAIGHLSWDAPRPGRRLLSSALPIIGLLSLLTLVATTVVGRASARQTAALLREKSLARTDTLTGLVNRAGLDDILRLPRVADALAEGHAAVIYLDLNGFKKLNDNMGHDAGDMALQVVAERLRAAVRGNDYVARIGGDEFVCLLLDDAPCQAAEHVANRIIRHTTPPIHIGNYSHIIRPAIGVAMAEKNLGWAQLLARADMAMYRAKQQGGAQPVFYAERMALVRVMDTAQPVQ